MMLPRGLKLKLPKIYSKYSMKTNTDILPLRHFKYIANACRKRAEEIIMSKKTCKNIDKPINSMKEVCRYFLMYADSFQGLYETMYQVSVGSISTERMSNALIEWDVRMSSIAHIPTPLRSWWSTIIINHDHLSNLEMQKRACNLIEMIKSSGIIRDSQNEFIAQQDTNMYYQTSDGTTWSLGQKLCIDSPCWYLPSTPVRIIEKGYCEIK